MDNLTKTQRSRTMSKIRSRWTVQERLVRRFLKQRNITCRMHPKMRGSPDILLPKSKTAVFLHGCFWHACPKCYKEPKTNRSYWLPKIRNNRLRDKRSIQALKKHGWKVKIIWEHQIKKNIERACAGLSGKS